MEIPTEEQIVKWFFECLYTDNFVDTLNSYQIEKVYYFAVDYEHKLKPTISEMALNFLDFGTRLEDNPMRENVRGLISILKVKKESANRIDKIKLIDTQIEKDKKKFNELKILAQDIQDTKEQVKFWLDAKHEFQTNIDAHTLEVSGIVSTQTGLNQELLLDRLISSEIARLMGYIELDGTTTNDPEILKKNRVVMLLFELGIFDYLMEKYPILNETSVSVLVEKFTGINSGTIRPTYRAIKGTSREDRNNPYNSDANVKWLNEELKTILNK
jgi:hypothetical protein